ncbi:hypothetical protein C2E23DRAFT_866720 [Lenzites betulinus]|nr:hypothetical protein C2E23DRAFT_866720 [Lenzites betulinus]
MHTNRATRSVAASQLDAKLELLQQLGYESRFYDDDEDEQQPRSAPLPEKRAYPDRDTDRWIQTEYSWALEEAAESTLGIPDLFDVEEEDEEACLPCVYDPTFFKARQSAPSTPRTRSQSLTQSIQGNYDKPLPVPPLRLRPRPSLPLVPPPTPATTRFSGSTPSPPRSPRTLLSERDRTPPPSPRLTSRLSSSPKPRPFPRASAPSTAAARPSTQRHATYPSISSTMSVLEERETEVEKRTAVYVAEEQPSFAPTFKHAGPLPRSADDFSGTFPLSSSPERKRRPTLPQLTTSHSTPQLRNLAELATMPSPSLAPISSLLPSLMSDATGSPDAEFVTLDSPEEADGEATLASRWSLDSVASRPRIRQASADATKRDRSIGRPSPPPPNTPRGSSDVLDIRRSSSREAMHSASRPSFHPSVRTLAPSVSSSSSSNASSASTLATPIEPMLPSPLPDLDPFGSSAPSCMFDEEPIPSRPTSPGSPPPQPTLPLPSPSTPSPSLFLPAPRSQSFFASLTNRQRRRRKKLVISGSPLYVDLGRASSSLSASQVAEDARNRVVEQQRRVENVIKWCESFGPTRKIEKKEDGSLHVYWKDWEVADMVCRVQAQVYIRDVGRVNLAWSYIS